MADTKTYSGITRHELNELRDKLRAQNLDVPREDKAVLTGPHGIRLQVTYNEVSHTLKVVILGKSFYVSEDAIWEKLDQALGTYTRN